MLLSATTCSSASAGLRIVSGRRVPPVASRRGVAAPARPQHSLVVSEQSRWAPLAPPPRAAAGEPLGSEDEPETAREAIELGNKYAKAARWQEALAVYEKALTLPGTGLKRFKDKPRLISDGERSAALFNIACCQAQLGDLRSGLVAMAGCLELGYDDFAQLRSDPDLEPLRQDERFEGLLKRFERSSSSPLSGFMGAFFGKK
ncbi:hypothetical protein PLESTB_001151700 [Pleodorina starrii]|uniref:Uncharacterized protein n=1 Tax=Pleodorina starrii TaxID=330485 RepID=A0A9W6BSA4_9CHLO|nr:hypothetical protein PLESTM_001783900 [Pleodorina starrii]GLC56812.1 hypothetical protein PLESTB_001151700 [Pleodorina starrii]GLC68148.1 hypothetical protein PLESTF_000653600 [Pleodorina starrii]